MCGDLPQRTSAGFMNSPTVSSYESIPEWCGEIRAAVCQSATPVNVRSSPINGIKGEVVVTLKKQQYYLWRCVDALGNVLDVLLQRQRDTQAACAILS